MIEKMLHSPSPSISWRKDLKKLKGRRIYIYKAYLLILPSLIICFSLGFYPLLQVICYSFFYKTLEDEIPTFQGLSNFLRIFNTEIIRNSLVTTFYFVVGAVSIEMLLGLGLALLLNREFRGKGIYRYVIIFPMAISPMLAALMWDLTLLPETGPVNYILEILGLPQPKWFAGSALEAFLAVILVDVWQWTPFVILVLLSGLQAVPQQLCEAAKIDGANRMQVFRYVILPYLRNLILLVLLIRVADAFRTMDMIYGTTNGGPGTATLVFSLLLYYVVYSQHLLGIGSAMAIIMFIILYIICTAAFKVARGVR